MRTRLTLAVLALAAVLSACGNTSGSDQGSGDDAGNNTLVDITPAKTASNSKP